MQHVADALLEEHFDATMDPIVTQKVKRMGKAVDERSAFHC